MSSLAAVAANGALDFEELMIGNEEEETGQADEHAGQDVNDAAEPVLIDLSMGSSILEYVRRLPKTQGISGRGLTFNRLIKVLNAVHELPANLASITRYSAFKSRNFTPSSSILKTKILCRNCAMLLLMPNRRCWKPQHRLILWWRTATPCCVMHSLIPG